MWQLFKKTPLLVHYGQIPILGISAKAFFWSALSSICPAFIISVRSQPEAAKGSQKTQNKTKKKVLTRKSMCQTYIEYIFNFL